MFYLRDMATLKANDTIEGLISVRPNEKNPRDLDIAIEHSVKGAHPSQEKNVYRM